MALFYLPFWGLLRKETFFQINRYALLGIATLSFLFPLIRIPEITPILVTTEILPVYYEEIEVLYTYEGEIAERPIDWMSIITWIYWMGVFAYFIYKMYHFIRLLRFIPKGCLWKEKKNGLYIHCHARKVTPFSWMKHIVISEEDYRENGEAILLHEKAHIACKHSWDVLWISIIEVLQWFNPFVWMLSNDLQDIHEYEADLTVLRQGVNAKDYQRLIITKAVSSGSYAFANSFNHSSLKKRITMMIKKKSNPWARIKYLYVLPLATIAVAAFARPEVSSDVYEISSVKGYNLANEVKSVENSSNEKIDEVQNLKEVNVVGYASTEAETSSTNNVAKSQREQEEKAIFQVVEEMPMFPSGMEECLKFIAKNINYPTVAQQAGIEGRVIVQFLVGNKGDISEVKVLRGVSPELDAEAVRVVSMMPKWTPGKQRGKAVNVKYSLPVNFSLHKDNAKKKQNLVIEGNPLIVVNGEVKGNNPEILKNMSPEMIKSISVVKNQQAMIDAYGDKAKDGVILTTTKDSSIEEEKVIFQIVEEMPMFPGGTEECLKFIAQNTKYPASAHKNGIQGRVLVTFVVTDQGDIQAPTIMKGVDPDLNAEALRIIKMMPKWKPGKQRGKAVNVKYTLPVNFRLQ